MSPGRIRSSLTPRALYPARATQARCETREALEPRSDRYEPLPGVTGLPRWVWRKLPPAGKAGLGLFALAVVALVILLGPGIRESNEERRRTEAERRAAAREQRAARLRAEQRPRFGSARAAGADPAARAALFGDARVAVGSDARRRVAAGALDGPILRVTCEPYPRGSASAVRASSAAGRFACLAVTLDVPPSERAEAAAIGHPYRLRIDFGSGRFALCKISGRAGEGSIGTAPLVAVPRACGGR